MPRLWTGATLSGQSALSNEERRRALDPQTRQAAFGTVPSSLPGVTSLRDAVGRAARLERADDGQGAMRFALETGDRELARAVAAKATTRVGARCSPSGAGTAEASSSPSCSQKWKPTAGAAAAARPPARCVGASDDRKPNIKAGAEAAVLEVLRDAPELRASATARSLHRAPPRSRLRSVKRQVVEHLGQLDFLHAKDNVVCSARPAPAKPSRDRGLDPRLPGRPPRRVRDRDRVGRAPGRGQAPQRPRRRAQAPVVYPAAGGRRGRLRMIVKSELPVAVSFARVWLGAGD